VTFLLGAPCINLLTYLLTYLRNRRLLWGTELKFDVPLDMVTLLTFISLLTYSHVMHVICIVLSILTFIYCIVFTYMLYSAIQPFKGCKSVP